MFKYMGNNINKKYMGNNINKAWQINIYSFVVN